MLEKICNEKTNVKVKSFEGLLVDFATSESVDAIVKGLRAMTDFDYEFQMAQANSTLKGFETQRHASTGIRSGDERPIGLRGPEPPDGHGPEVVTGPEGVHRRDRLRGAELQTTGIHLLDNR